MLYQTWKLFLITYYNLHSSWTVSLYWTHCIYHQGLHTNRYSYPTKWYVEHGRPSKSTASIRFISNDQVLYWWNVYWPYPMVTINMRDVQVIDRIPICMSNLGFFLLTRKFDYAINGWIRNVYKDLDKTVHFRKILTVCLCNWSLNRNKRENKAIFKKSTFRYI